MSRSLVLMDIGDVLVATIPMAHFRALSRLTGLPNEDIALRLESSGLVAGFERGTVSEAEFGDEVRSTLDCPDLSAGQMERAWDTVIGRPDPTLTPIAAELADQGRLELASNTNPFHWRLIQKELAALDIETPAHLSYRIGHAKPHPGFYAALPGDVGRGGGPPVFVDDRPENVAAAQRRGLLGWRHRDPTTTATFLLNLLG